MSYNAEFEDTMDSVNNIAKGMGFKNGIDWAAQAQKKNEISYHEYTQFSNCHNLRIRLSHGNARDISVSSETNDIARSFLNKIQRSSMVKGKRNINIPDGGFRGKPFIKTFNWNGEDGRTYHFEFSIHNEYNYLDDGYGGDHATGYFIHIDEAPYLDYALGHLHEFHIIRTNADNHICWNKNIESFEEANAVMFVWVKRYVALLIEIMKEKDISESELIKRVNRKNILPAGTFRSKKAGSKNNHCKSVKKKDIFIRKSVYDQIMEQLSTTKPELGGMLGWTEDQSVIDSFVFDEGARVNSVEYNPNIDFLNNILQNEWDHKGIYLGGFVHSHPGDYNRLSPADIEYSMRIMDAFEAPYLFMPIVTSSYAYKSSFNPYIVRRNGHVERCNLIIEDDDKSEENVVEDFSPDLLSAIEKGFDDMDARVKNEKVISGKKETNNTDQDSTFARIETVIDLEYMSQCTIIGIGCGGSRGFYEDMARVGVGNFILIDGDISSRSNIGSQNGYLSDIGKFKTQVVKSRIVDINEKANVKTFDIMLTDELTDDWVENNVLNGLDAKKTLICAFTDDFWAQARAEALSQKYQIPYLSAQHHQFGETSEVIYWYPGISKFTVKDILKSRYEYYQNGNKNTVTSEGSPIFNTTRLNALCDKIAVGMLLYGFDKMSDFGSFLRLKPENNLLLIRQKHLAFSESSLRDMFEETDRLMFDDTIWVNPNDIDNEKCKKEDKK